MQGNQSKTAHRKLKMTSCNKDGNKSELFLTLSTTKEGKKICNSSDSLQSGSWIELGPCLYLSMDDGEKKQKHTCFHKVYSGFWRSEGEAILEELSASDESDEEPYQLREQRRKRRTEPKD